MAASPAIVDTFKQFSDMRDNNFEPQIPQLPSYQSSVGAKGKKESF